MIFAKLNFKKIFEIFKIPIEIFIYFNYLFKNLNFNLALVPILSLNAILISCASIDHYTQQSIYEKKLEGISVLKQKYSYSCNLTAIAIVKRYIGYKVDENSIRKYLKIEDRKKGMLPYEFQKFGNEALSDTPYIMVQKNFNSQNLIIEEIKSSLESKLPVVMYYSTINDWDRPNFDTHYSVIYGLRTQSKTIFTSNSYGYLQELSFDEFFAGLSYQNYQREPLPHQIARLVKIIKPNNLFFLKSRNSL
jgi:hypothetical protein